MEPVLLPDVRQEGYWALDESTRGPWLGAAYLSTPCPSVPPDGSILCAQVPWLVQIPTQTRRVESYNSSGSPSLALPLVPKQDPPRLWDLCLLVTRRECFQLHQVQTCDFRLCL